MNPAREYVFVSRPLVDRGLKFGRDLAAHYAAGGSPRSRARSGDRGTECNPLRLAQGKIGECALAIVALLDPDVSVRWDVRYADCGWDLELLGGTLVDVKTTFPKYKLIWSRNVNDLYEEKHFSILVSVSIDPNDFCKCWVEGWVTKREFLARKAIADGANGLEPGTWFMEKADLRRIKSLVRIDIDRLAA